MKLIVMRKPFVVLFLMITAHAGWSQLTSNKSGDIEYNGQVVAEVEKYGGNAQTKPRFRVLTAARDTLMDINFKKDLEYDWLQFRIKNVDRVVEVEESEIISGLNYRKNIGNWLVKKNLLKEDGTLNDTAFRSFLASHTENLTEKYDKLNEFPRKILSTKFEYKPEDGNKLFINGRHVGFATVPDGQAVTVFNIAFYDVNMKVIGKGDRDMSAGGATFRMNDAKTLKINIVGGTTSVRDKIIFITSLFRELTRSGYYQI
jgi:hypothetical protein